MCLDKSCSVADMVSWKDGVGEWQWRWRRVLFQWEVEQVAELQELIMRAGFKGNGLDRWVCIYVQELIMHISSYVCLI